MRRVFASLEHPDKYGYAFDTEHYESGAQLCGKFRQFETGGHNLIQHSSDWAITREYFADYLASLATAMLADSELTPAVQFSFRAKPSIEKIQFAASVIWREADEWTKPRWYSLEEMKVSSTRSKEHDKRYQRVEKWNDGTPEAIYRMLVPDYARELDFYIYADAVRDWVLVTPNQYMGLTAEFLKWTTNSEVARKYRYAFNAVTSLIESYRFKLEAETNLRNYQNYIKPVEAETVETVEAITETE